MMLHYSNWHDCARVVDAFGMVFRVMLLYLMADQVASHLLLFERMSSHLIGIKSPTVSKKKKNV